MMIILFGVSWPASLHKSYKEKSTRGKSLIFLICILAGYAFGIVSKLTSGTITYVLFFYCLNFLMVTADLCLYFKNKKYENL